jgi:hypothetical protein
LCHDYCFQVGKFILCCKFIFGWTGLDVVCVVLCEQADAVPRADAVPEEDAAVHDAEAGTTEAEEVVFTLELVALEQPSN